MGKDFHSVTVFLRVCCTMIHGFHAVGRYMHCVCTHSFVVCVLLHCRIQVFFRCSSMFDQCNILNFQAFPTLCLHFSAALPGSSLMLPLRLPFLVRSCHRHPPPNRTLSLFSSKVTPCQVACRFSSPLVSLFLLLLERDWTSRPGQASLSVSQLAPHYVSFTRWLVFIVCQCLSIDAPLAQ